MITTRIKGFCLQRHIVGLPDRDGQAVNPVLTPVRRSRGVFPSVNPESR
jgi:hypothetical protein